MRQLKVLYNASFLLQPEKPVETKEGLPVLHPEFWVFKVETGAGGQGAATSA